MIQKLIHFASDKHAVMGVLTNNAKKAVTCIFDELLKKCYFIKCKGKEALMFLIPKKVPVM